MTPMTAILPQVVSLPLLFRLSPRSAKKANSPENRIATNLSVEMSMAYLFLSKPHHLLKRCLMVELERRRANCSFRLHPSSLQSTLPPLASNDLLGGVGKRLLALQNNVERFEF